MESRETIDLDLKKYLEKVKQHWLLIGSVFGATVLLSGLSTFFVKPSYIAEGKLRFKVNPAPLPTGLDEQAGELRPLVSTQNPISTEIEVIYARPLLQNMIDTVGLEHPQGKAFRPKDVLANLDVSIITGTDVLKLSYESDQPQEAAEVVNTLMHLYIQGDIQNQRSRALSARQFIASQLPQREMVVKEAEEVLSRFKEKNNIIDLEVEEETTVTAISKLDSEITIAQSEFDATVARTNTLKNQVGLDLQSAISASKLSQSSEIKEILRELQSVERQLATARREFKEGFPTVVRLKERQAALKNLLSRKSQTTIQSQPLTTSVRAELDDPEQSLILDFLAAEVQKQAVAKRLTSLKRERSKYDRRIQSLPGLKRTLLELERKSKAAQATYETLLKKLQELQVAENTNTSNAQIIEAALIPTEGTAFMKKATILVFGTLLGTFLATATIPILAMRQRYLQKSQIKALENGANAFPDSLDYPLLSVISHTELRYQTSYSGTDLLISMLEKMHCMIKANSQLFIDNPSLKTFVVTSIETQEGKSTVAANLAIAMAQLEKEVLLIDANIQNPKQHHLFNLPNELGLSNAIQDKSIRPSELQMIIHRACSNLNILTAGSIYDSPMSILSSSRLGQFLKYFAWNYDVVILDSSSLLDADGASALAMRTDGLLLVTNPAITQENELETAKEIMPIFEHKILGMIVNHGQTKDYSKVYLPSFKINLSRQKKN